VWGRDSLKWVFKERLAFRQKDKRNRTIKHGNFDKWLKTRSSREQTQANKLVDILIEDDELDPESMSPLLAIIKSSIESFSFHELIDALGSGPQTPSQLVELFDEWRIIEAREHLMMAEGRAKALGQLQQYMIHDADEVKEVEPLLAKHPWMFDSAWREVNVEQRYTQLLRDFAKEKKATPESDKRLDIVAVRASGSLVILELKRPGKTLSLEDLNQIEKYVDWAHGNLVGTGTGAPTSITGMLLIGKPNPAHARKMGKLLNDGIVVQTYQDVVTRAEAERKTIEKRLEAVAPEWLKYRKTKIEDVK